MKSEYIGMIIGISIGVIVGVLLAVFSLLFIRFRRKHAQVHRSSSDQRGVTIPIRFNGVDSSVILSDSTIGHESPPAARHNGLSLWWEGHTKNMVASASGILRYPYKDLQKATQNFTTVIGQGAFGPVYKATMPSGEIVAVKSLSTDSKQGEQEFQTEVSLLGRLHHRNLVNLLGYCVDKGHRMLIYVYMSNGSLAHHLYNEHVEPLSWDLRVYIAQDISRGIEYLHDGAVPPVVHRDIKSPNILLDRSMRARVADFGLSKEEKFDGRSSGLKGTFGYVDPEYVSSKNYTKNSDVYSFGILLFELIAARNPQQGLMDYINLAAISADGKAGWEEIVDARLNGKYNIEEVRSVAAIAYKCVQKNPRKRPTMRDIAQDLSRINEYRHTTNNNRETVSTVEEESFQDMENRELTKIDFDKTDGMAKALYV
ncbi:calcium/calmodulin-regulated receptor-like kinase 1 isoform X1 [Cryptomeria japonica]|uniref:calcium/calmodulin-regulated receptor-like kinase 1 isoform X1 n=1 Tax=Cryptomeria japonica TaxID=3369 RepID=UPI0027DA5724|nr:calcium/calmodulin-regulated receptor-like kinase 1 isoform X1 [Cryptomeria japonica]